MAEGIWRRLVQGSRRVWTHGDWARVLAPDWAERIMTVDVTDRFHAKQGRSTGRWIVENERGRLAVYLKRHYRLPWWHGLLAILWPQVGWSPAEQERKRLAWAARHALPVPRVLASAEFVGPRGRLQSMLAVEELDGMLPLNEAIPLASRRLHARDFAPWKRGLIAELARLTQLLHGRNRFHKDLYLCHFYVPERLTYVTPGWTDQVFMIDFHRLGHHLVTWPWWLVKDLAELLYSSDVEGVTARDRLRFWRDYRSSRPVFGAWLFRLLILAQWRNYRAHNLKRRLRTKTINASPAKRSA